MPQQELQSRIFESLTFTGKRIKECPSEVTYHDKGEIPLYAHSIDLNYSGENITISVRASEKDQDYCIKGRNDPKTQRRELLFDPQLIAAYQKLINQLKLGKQRTMRNKPLNEKYPDLQNYDIENNTHFKRYAFITLGDETNPESLFGGIKTPRLRNLERVIANALKLENQTQEDTRLITYNNGIYRIQISNTPIMPGISIISDEQVQSEEEKALIEEIRKEIAIRDPSLSLPTPDYSNPNSSGVDFGTVHKTGHHNPLHPIIQAAFKEDLDQLELKEYGHS